MAYVSKNLSELNQLIGGRGQRLWIYWSADSIGTITGAGYVSDATSKRMQIGDVVLAFSGTLSTTGADQSPSTHAAGTVSEFASAPTFAILECSSISSGAATLTAAALGSESLANPTLTGTINIGGASDTVGFYGGTPVARPHSTNEAQVTTAAITSVTTVSATSATGITFGYTTTTQANAIVTAINALIVQEAADRVLLNQLQADLVSLNLIKGTG